jgi:hypothetical protein
MGILEKGKQNALQLGISHLELQFPNLPPAFDGYTILFMSDLHLDGLKGLTEQIIPILRKNPADLCIIGGDFRMATHGPYDAALEELRRLLPEIRAEDGILAVLGNHDCIEMEESLRRDGVNLLLNEAFSIDRNGDQVWIVGVDDPHYYKCHDLKAAFAQVPNGDFSILVAHSNEIYKEAESFAPQLYLCGHTHAGQIQVPNFGPIFTHSSAPRKFCYGLWRHGRMLGYTSCGVGVSGVPVRFFSKGEIALITLRRGPVDSRGWNSTS